MICNTSLNNYQTAVCQMCVALYKEVLRRHHMNNTPIFLTKASFFFHLIFSRLLRALALSDLCVMVTGALLYGMPGLSSTYLHDIQPMISPYLLPIAQTSIMTSVYLAVVMAFERYIRICFTCQLRPFRCISSKNLM